MTGRPRKQRVRQAPDPGRHQPCVRCGDCYPPYGRWPEGLVCEYCARLGMRTSGTCATCGHVGGLPGLDEQRRPTCRSCSGITLPLDCLRCGAEGQLYRAGTCIRCALGDDVDLLLGGTNGIIATPLLPLADAIKTMPSARSGITWLQSPKVKGLLRGLGSAEIALTHQSFDQLPASRSVEYLRGLLIGHGMLPARDKHLAQYGRWFEAKLAGIEDADQRRLIELYGHWHQLRYLRSQAAKGEVARTTFLRAKQSTTVAIDFLGWLKHRGRRIGECTQHDIDAYFASGPSTRLHARSFLYWAKNARKVRGVEIPGGTVTAHATFGNEERLQALRDLLLDETIDMPWRIAGILVLLLGQPAERIAGLTVDHVHVELDERVLVRPATDWLDVPEPFACLLRTYLPQRRNMATAANRDSSWLFPGGMPGRHVDASHIVNQLRAIGVPVLPSRMGTWRQLVREAPPSILAQALGIAPVTAMKHAERAGGHWLRYPALRQTSG